MMPIQKTMMQIGRMAVRTIGRGSLKGPATYRSYCQKFEPVKRRVSPLQSMREFFLHPMTWDRNNGYLNVLLALAIFGFCFLSSCKPCEEKNPLDIKRKK